MSRKKAPIAVVHEYINQGMVDDLKAFLKSLPLNDACDVCSEEYPRRGTSIHVAASHGHTSILKLLIEDIGVDVNLKLTEGFLVSGQTALHEACLGGYSGSVAYLISKGANVNSREQDGQSPLHCACQGKSIEVFKLLLKYGAVIDAPDNKGQTPLQQSILRAPLEVTKCLIENGADLEVLDSDGQNPLHYAVEWGNIELVRILLNMDVNVNIQDKDGRTPIHLALPHPDILDLLLENGADPDIRDNTGKPAIEKRLDLEKDEYKAINDALSQHMTKASDTRTVDMEAARLAQERIRKLTVADGTVKEAKSNVMAELLSKGRKEDESLRNPEPSPLAAAGVLGELKSKTGKNT